MLLNDEPPEPDAFVVALPEPPGDVVVVVEAVFVELLQAARTSPKRTMPAMPASAVAPRDAERVGNAVFVMCKTPALDGTDEEV